MEVVVFVFRGLGNSLQFGFNHDSRLDIRKDCRGISSVVDPELLNLIRWDTHFGAQSVEVALAEDEEESALYNCQASSSPGWSTHHVDVVI